MQKHIRWLMFWKLQLTALSLLFTMRWRVVGKQDFWRKIGSSAVNLFMELTSSFYTNYGSSSISRRANCISFDSASVLLLWAKHAFFLRIEVAKEKSNEAFVLKNHYSWTLVEYLLIYCNITMSWKISMRREIKKRCTSFRNLLVWYPQLFVAWRGWCLYFELCLLLRPQFYVHNF